MMFVVSADAKCLTLIYIIKIVRDYLEVLCEEGPQLCLQQMPDGKWMDSL